MSSCSAGVAAQREQEAGVRGGSAACSAHSPEPLPPSWAGGRAALIRAGGRAGGRHLALCSRAEYSVSDTREASMSLVRPVLAEYLKMKAFMSS